MNISGSDNSTIVKNEIMTADGSHWQGDVRLSCSSQPCTEFDLNSTAKRGLFQFTVNTTFQNSIVHKSKPVLFGIGVWKFKDDGYQYPIHSDCRGTGTKPSEMSCEAYVCEHPQDKNHPLSWWSSSDNACELNMTKFHT